WGGIIYRSYPRPQNLRYPDAIQPRTGGLQATVAGWALHGIASHVRSGDGRPATSDQWARIRRCPKRGLSRGGYVSLNHTSGAWKPRETVQSTNPEAPQALSGAQPC